MASAQQPAPSCRPQSRTRHAPARCPGRPPPVRWPACPLPSDCPPATVAACSSRRPANGGGARSPSGQWTHHSAQGAGGPGDGAGRASTLPPCPQLGSGSLRPPLVISVAMAAPFLPLSGKSQSLRAPGSPRGPRRPEDQECSSVRLLLRPRVFSPLPCASVLFFPDVFSCPGASCPCSSF